MSHQLGVKDMIMPGGMELLIIAGVVLLLFGGNKLPKLGGALGESIKNFKKGIQDADNVKSVGESSEKKAIDQDRGKQS